MASQSAVGHDARITLKGDDVSLAVAERDCLDAVEQLHRCIRSVELLKPSLETHLARVQEQCQRLAIRA